MANLAGAHYESEYEQFPLSFPVRPAGSLDLGPPGGLCAPLQVIVTGGGFGSLAVCSSSSSVFPCVD